MIMARSYTIHQSNISQSLSRARTTDPILAITLNSSTLLSRFITSLLVHQGWSMLYGDFTIHGAQVSGPGYVDDLIAWTWVDGIRRKKEKRGRRTWYGLIGMYAYLYSLECLSVFGQDCGSLIPHAGRLDLICVLSTMRFAYTLGTWSDIKLQTYMIVLRRSNTILKKRYTFDSNHIRSASWQCLNNSQEQITMWQIADAIQALAATQIIMSAPLPWKTVSLMKMIQGPYGLDWYSYGTTRVTRALFDARVGTMRSNSNQETIEHSWVVRNR